MTTVSEATFDTPRPQYGRELKQFSTRRFLYTVFREEATDKSPVSRCTASVLHNKSKVLYLRVYTAELPKIHKTVLPAFPTD